MVHGLHTLPRFWPSGSEGAANGAKLAEHLERNRMEPMDVTSEGSLLKGFVEHVWSI